MIVVACLNVWFFLDFRDVTTGIQPSIALIYIGMSLLLGVLISTIVLYVQRQTNDGRRRAVGVFASAVIGPLLYLVTLAFSYGVFQNIPATRGGGDYTASPRVVVTFKRPLTPLSGGARYVDPRARDITIPLILIEETSWAFYLADPAEAGGPREWKSIGGTKPSIFVVNKMHVTNLYAESRNPVATAP